MTELNPGPIPGAETPAPAEAPKKRNVAKIIGTVVVVLLALGGLVYKYVLPAINEAKLVVGACIDTSPDGEDGDIPTPKVLDCTDSGAQSKIIGVFDGTLNDAERLCPEDWYSAIESDGKLLCIVPNE